MKTFSTPYRISRPTVAVLVAMHHLACGDAVSIERRNQPNMPVRGEPLAETGGGAASSGGAGGGGAAVGGAGAGAAGDGGAGDGAAVGGGAGSSADTKYVASSVVFNPEGEQTYVIALDSLSPQVVDYAKAIELPGWADIWVHEGQLYVSSGESPTVTKYSVTQTGELVEQGVLSFAAYGEVDVAFWSNTFVAPDKAYMINGVGGYVIWDPVRMVITGTFELPELPPRDGLLVRAGTLDRANVIRDGKLYQPMYWSDTDFAVFAPESRIVVIDIASDEVEATIDAPCAGLDIGALDEAGNLYFSTWTGGIYQPLVLGDAGNCVARIAAGQATADVAFTFAEVAGGREGAAVRHFDDGKLLMSVFHDERVDFEGAEDPWALISERNWRTWLHDPQTGETTPVDSLDWNSGATYVFRVDEVNHVMVPSADYAETAVVALSGGLDATEVFEMRGWGIRLFKLR